MFSRPLSLALVLSPRLLVVLLLNCRGVRIKLIKCQPLHTDRGGKTVGLWWKLVLGCVFLSLPFRFSRAFFSAQALGVVDCRFFVTVGLFLMVPYLSCFQFFFFCKQFFASFQPRGDVFGVPFLAFFLAFFHWVFFIMHLWKVTLKLPLWHAFRSAGSVLVLFDPFFPVLFWYVSLVTVLNWSNKSSLRVIDFFKCVRLVWRRNHVTSKKGLQNVTKGDEVQGIERNLFIFCIAIFIYFHKYNRYSSD